VNVITVGTFVIVLLVWANDGARTKPRRSKPFIHFIYKGKFQQGWSHLSHYVSCIVIASACYHGAVIPAKTYAQFPLFCQTSLSRSHCLWWITSCAHFFVERLFLTLTIQDR